jgi:hypothetical protein
MQQVSEHALVTDGELRGTQALGEARDTPELPEKPSVEEKVLKVLVGIPLKGHTPPASYHDRMLMWKHLGGQEATDFYEKKNPRFVFALGAIGEILVPYARERLAESALKIGADYLFMVDDDMLAPADLFYRLAAHDKDIVAALAFTRNPDHKPVIYETIEGYDQSAHESYGLTRFVMNYPRNTLVECDAVGFGAVLIKTEVLRKVPKPWFFGMAQTGEDITLCIKAKKVGFRVWMDTSIKLGHLGDATVITEEYSDAWNKLSPEERETLYGKYQKYETQD